jgi:hypothetical protein
VDGGERHPTVGDWLSNVGSKGGKASAPSQTASHVEQVAMDNESEVAYVRAVMENLPTLARSPVPGQAAGPKMGKVFGPYNTLVYGIHSERDPVQSNVLRPRNNGRAERWDPPTALPATGAGGQAECLGGKDGSRSKGSAVTVEIS